MAEKKKVTVKAKQGKAGKKTQKTKQKTVKLPDVPDDVAARAREIWLAGLGALATAEAEGSKLFGTLVEKGTAWEKERAEDLAAVKKKFDEAAAKAKKKGKKAAGEMDHRVALLEESVEGLMSRFGGLVRTEVTELGKRLDALMGQVNQLAAGAKARITGETVPTVYEVVAREEGWAVQQTGADRASSLHANKREAVSAGRELAKNHAPSLLVIQRQDGSVQDRVSYDAPAEAAAEASA